MNPILVWRPGVRTLILACALAGAVAACSPLREQPLEQSAEGTAVLLKGTPAPEAPADPAFQQLTALQVEGSLRSLQVYVSKWATFVRTEEAKPFLSAGQVVWMRDVLVKWLPRLEPDQRVEFRFRDRFKSFDVQVRVYPDGEYIAYQFLKLAADPSVPTDNSVNFPTAWVQFAPQPGQIVERHRTFVLLEDPVREDTKIRAELLAAKRALVDEARKDEVIDEAEAGRLDSLIQERPQITLETWRLYFDKRHTLERARQQGFFSDAEYRERLEGLNAELDAGTQ